MTITFVRPGLVLDVTEGGRWRLTHGENLIIETSSLGQALERIGIGTTPRAGLRPEMGWKHLSDEVP